MSFICDLMGEVSTAAHRRTTTVQSSRLSNRRKRRPTSRVSWDTYHQRYLNYSLPRCNVPVCRYSETMWIVFSFIVISLDLSTRRQEKREMRKLRLIATPDVSFTSFSPGRRTWKEFSTFALHMLLQWPALCGFVGSFVDSPESCAPVAAPRRSPSISSLSLCRLSRLY